DMVGYTCSAKCLLKTHYCRVLISLVLLAMEALVSSGDRCESPLTQIAVPYWLY
ncbi:hypothetical protein L9F63_024602, partial [Diploptera punctata]